MFRTLRQLTFFLLLLPAGRLLYAETIPFNELPPRQMPVCCQMDGGVAFYDSFLTGFTDPKNPEGPISSGAQYAGAGYYPFQTRTSGYGLPLSVDAPYFYPASGAEFTLNSMDIFADPPTIPILGYRKGVLVYQALSDQADASGLIALNWSGIDAVVFPHAIQEEGLGLGNISVNVAAIPEPSSILLLGSCLAGLFTLARRRQQT
jgi:hypothetical protein